jgi:hypothetical protein
MKKEIKFIKENFVAIVILIYCIYTVNWLAVGGWILYISGKIYSDYLDGALKEAWDDIDRWYHKYMEVKYPKINQK